MYIYIYAVLSASFILTYKLNSDVIHSMYITIKINHTVVFWPHFYNISALRLKPMKTSEFQNILLYTITYH